MAVLDRLTQLQCLFERLLKEHATLKRVSAGLTGVTEGRRYTQYGQGQILSILQQQRGSRGTADDRYQEFTKLCDAAFKGSLHKEAQQGVPALKLAEAAR